VFTRTKHGAKALTRQLNRSGVPAVDLHGNLSQGARTRNMEAFHSGRATTLVATDIAARGIHVDDVALVVHADPPAEHKAYLHRSGRTARAGASGTVITLMTDEQRRDVQTLTRAAGIKPRTTRIDGPAHPMLVTLAPGERSLPGGLIVEAQAGSGPNGNRGGGGGGRNRGRRPSGQRSGQPKAGSGGKPRRSSGGQPRRPGGHSAARFSSGR
jgi:superfamily II DNA/RNA helicase